VVVFIAAGHQKAHHGSHAPPAGPVVELDRGMPPSVVGQVLSALGQESDPARLDALGGSLEAHYPLSASELRAKAAMLRASSTGGAGGAGPAALPVAVAPAALPAAQEPARALGSEQAAPAVARTPAARDLDVATVLQAAMRALVEETDPVVLDGFAESIRAPYPAAAEILASRAHALRASAALPPVAGLPPATVEPTTSAAASSSTSAPSASQVPS
jgi:hypothetical protein